MSGDRTTRERLLEAAISIIENEGEDGVRVDRVAELAGFTKPVVYHHFADREDLVVAALSERYLRAINFPVDEVKFAAARCRTAEQFRVLMIQVIKSYGDEEGVHRRRLRIEALGAAVSRPALQASLVAAMRQRVDALAGILQIAREEGWLRIGVEPRDLSMWWAGLILGRHLAEIDGENFDMAVWDSITSWVIEKLFDEP